MEKDNSTQQMVQINDQKIDSNNVQSMIRTMEAKAPVVLIVCKDYHIFFCVCELRAKL